MSEDDINQKGLSDKLAPRARNRTVVLTPEMTGQVRARLNVSDEPEDKNFIDSAKLGQHLEQRIKQQDIPAPQSSSSQSIASQSNTFNSGFNVPQDTYGNKNIRSEENTFQPPPRPQNTTNNNSFRSNYGESSQFIPPSQVTQSRPSVNEPPKVPFYQHLNQPVAESTILDEPIAKVAPPKSTFYQPIAESTRKQQELLLSLVGFLVSFDQNPYGEAFELREGRTIVSCDVPSGGGTVLLLNDPSISSMHAVIRATKDGNVVLLDQLSDSGTYVTTGNDQELKLNGEMAPLKHGDTVRFGDRTFSFCSIATRLNSKGSDV
jgi:hypothetical protein